ncbi:minor capsid protein [Secundilactobacillus pentosiphilus]|uniref:Minor capsid protein n=1 Tax=Secundilactobacillus pentosiphilus TaxID=1714682 RepID=A0A1Z5IYS6_9LACO|nr:phage portal protein [Secundilactobacillus pentosiphilus]GAX06819.1 minor capsid protein [Secundilactobacillus pentosiphilus]
MVNSLSKITDDARISIDPKEYERIDRDIDYYSDKLAYVKYMNSYGQYKRRPRNTINMTKTAARRLASIIFNEKAEISIKNDQQTNDFINQVLLDNDFKNQFEEQLERGIAMGGFAMRPYVDNDKIKIAWVRADQFYPLHSNTNNISEAAIASKTTVTENHNNVYYTLLEFHQWQGLDYIITNELYRSEDPTQVGMQVPLNSLENYEDLANQVLITNFVRPLFVYFKTPGANNVTLDSPLGLGIVDNAKHILDNINTTHDQFIWEIRLGNRRIAVPRTMLKTDDAHPPMFDSEQNVYAPLLTDDMTQGVTDLTSDIRTQQYTDAMNHWIEELETQIGLSTGTFSYADSGLKTATEVASDNSMTYQTRSSYLTMVEKAIDGLCEAILELAGQGQLFSNGQPLYTYDLVNKPLEVECHFDDGIFVDKDKQLDEDTKTLLAGALSKQTFLQRNYGMSDEEVQQELAKIQDEAPETTPEGQQFEDETGGDGE